LKKTAAQVKSPDDADDADVADVADVADEVTGLKHMNRV
jgi:hypothetical protein